MNHDQILENSLKLSRPFWELYEQLIYNRHHKPREDDLEEEISVVDDEDDDNDDDDVALEPHDTDQDAKLNAEYLEFIRVTREHQARRERDKRLRQKKGLDVEAYYKDISQVDTLVEDNLVEAPEKGDCSQGLGVKQKELNLIEFYGGCEAYETIRSFEMIIDELFQKKCRELKPIYWPVMPINPRRYLNPIDR